GAPSTSTRSRCETVPPLPLRLRPAADPGPARLGRGPPGGRDRRAQPSGSLGGAGLRYLRELPEPACLQGAQRHMDSRRARLPPTIPELQSLAQKTGQGRTSLGGVLPQPILDLPNHFRAGQHVENRWGGLHASLPNESFESCSVLFWGTRIGQAQPLRDALVAAPPRCEILDLGSRTVFLASNHLTPFFVRRLNAHPRSQ